MYKFKFQILTQNVKITGKKASKYILNNRANIRTLTYGLKAKFKC